MMYDDSSSGLIPNKTLNNTLHDAEELSNKKVTRTSAKNYEIQFSFDSLTKNLKIQSSKKSCLKSLLSQPVKNLKSQSSKEARD